MVLNHRRFNHVRLAWDRSTGGEAEMVQLLWDRLCQQRDRPARGGADVDTAGEARVPAALVDKLETLNFLHRLHVVRAS